MTIEKVCGSSISTSMRTRLSMVARCGHSTVNITTPTRVSFASPLNEVDERGQARRCA